jgi:E3 ubiquitin-protein ligase HUWE1
MVILALNVLLRPAQQYSTQLSVSQSLSISTQRLQSLAKRWPSLREYGIGLADLSSPKGSPEVNALPTEAREVNFSFYRTDASLDYDKDKNMDTDVLDTSSSSTGKVPVPPVPVRSTFTSTSKRWPPNQLWMSSLTPSKHSVPDDEKLSHVTHHAPRPYCTRSCTTHIPSRRPPPQPVPKQSDVDAAPE